MPVYKFGICLETEVYNVYIVADVFFLLIHFMTTIYNNNYLQTKNNYI